MVVLETKFLKLLTERIYGRTNMRPVIESLYMRGGNDIEGVP